MLITEFNTNEIREIMKANKISNKEIAKEVEVSEAYISKIFKDTGTIVNEKMLYKLNEAIKKKLGSNEKINIQTAIIMARKGADEYNYIKNKKNGVEEYRSKTEVDKENIFVKLIHEKIKLCIEESVKKEIRSNSQVYEFIKEDELIFKSSVGTGTRADCAWIAILFKPFSTTTKKGIYPCLLVSKDHKRYYVCIMLGVDNIKNGYENIPVKVSEIRSICDEYIQIEKFDKERINLKDIEEKDFELSDKVRRLSTIGEKYELATIYSKKVDINNFEESLKNSVVEILKAFNIMIPILLEVNQSMEKYEDKKGKKRTIDHEVYMKMIEKLNEIKSKVGKAAEDFIYNREKVILEEAGIKEVDRKLKLIARERDGDGFDIQSVQIKDGKECGKKIIEVKGTSIICKNEFKFFMTDNEVSVAKDIRNREEGAAYVVALVHNVLSDKIELYDEIIEPFSREETIQIKPSLYKCSYKKKGEEFNV